MFCNICFQQRDHEINTSTKAPNSDGVKFRRKMHIKKVHTWCHLLLLSKKNGITSMIPSIAREKGNEEGKVKGNVILKLYVVSAF